MLGKLGTVSGLTLLSRIFGFLRDVVLAAALGAGPVADAFMLAFRLPNHFRALLAEGAFNAAFLPGYAALSASGGPARRFGAEVLGWLLLANLVLLAVALSQTGWVLSLLAPGLGAEDPTRALAITLTRITFPYLMCMSVVAYLGALLNSRDRFAATAAAPILLNLCMLATLWAAPLFPGVAQAAAVGVTLSGVAQVVLLAMAATRAGIALGVAPPRLSPETKAFFRRLGPAVLAAGALQISVLADTVLATFLPAGSLSTLYYADRLYQLPIGLIGVALGTVLLPDIGRRAGLGDADGMRRALDRAAMVCLATGLPMAVLMALLGDWAVEVLFRRGAFDAEAAQASAAILAAYALGLVPALSVRSLVAGFHGRGDTRTPLTALMLAAIPNLGLKLALAPVLGAAGLALATSAGMAVYAGLLWVLSRRRGHAGALPRGRVTGLLGTTAMMAAAVLALKAPLRAAAEAALPGGALAAALIALGLLGLALQAAGSALCLRGWRPA
ncbi:murein biosynthesis integral membrane protein MurJ [Rhodovulum kholense]|uniref:Probable lipid II flippase MurJ n=1 Tax=Rhodovulum kholense TaxID=453584 RepID=A0A8E3AQR5_9RHOB|nr:murein biosynthesis integral membrane protein MurJ [Rhodovulum kholense]PTW46170.1 putative peptidoglycan lipid II flippase [Rhodovulum kholense]